MNQPVSHHEALIFAMVTMSAVDRTMTDSELKKIGDVVQSMPVFEDFDEQRLITVAETCGEILQADDGLATILEMIRTCIPKKLHETAYAFSVEVAAADLHVEPEEVRFLQMLRDKLGIDKLTTAAIERGARARHRTV